MSNASVSAPVLHALRTSIRRAVKARRFQLEPLPAPSRRQLLVDVSVIVSGDAGTGIQRVVRALLGQLMAFAGPDLDVHPVFASRDHGYCRGKLNPDGSITSEAEKKGVLHPVVIRSGDVFLGLDLAAHLIPDMERDLQCWRQQGVGINFLVYDLLPVMRPEWFPPKTPANINRWLGVLARQADQCICISNAVAADLERELAVRSVRPLPKITTIPLGWDLSASYPSMGLPADIGPIRDWLRQHKAVLAVGTVEPRKGYDQLLSAMPVYWHKFPDADTALLIIGRRGWKTSTLQSQLQHHPENGNRLKWLDTASDELLDEIYDNVFGLVATSHGEGFGLPLIEALSHGLPILARDIPVFREIGGPRITYFDDHSPEALSASIAEWLADPKRPDRGICELPAWAHSARQLATLISVTGTNRS